MLTMKNKNKPEESDFAIFCDDKEEYFKKHFFDGYDAANQVTPLKSFFGKWYNSNGSLEQEKRLISRSLCDVSQTKQRRKERKRTKSLTFSLPVHSTNKPPNPLGPYPAQSATEAGRRIVNLLMLHAWRRRKEDNEEARAMISTLTDQTDSLNMQVYVLRQLLDSEKNRSFTAMVFIRKTLKKFEEYEKDRENLLKEKKTLECEISDLLSSMRDLKNKWKNKWNNKWKNKWNDLMTARLEAKSWEKQLKKERKKLNALKEENVILQKEVQMRNNHMVYQSQSLEKLNQEYKELEVELDIKITLLDEAMAQLHSAEEKLKQSEEAKLEQGKMLTEKGKELEQLKTQIAILEEKLREQDEHNGELGKLISEKTKELVIMNEKIGELTKRQKYWGNRVIRIASLCSRIPLACFYTVATLLLPQPSYRSL